MGRPVRDGEGRLLGVVRGLHQMFCPGDFEEVSIQNGRGILFVRVEELVPVGRELLLIKNA